MLGLNGAVGVKEYRTLEFEINNPNDVFTRRREDIDTIRTGVTRLASWSLKRICKS